MGRGWDNKVIMLTNLKNSKGGGTNVEVAV